MKKIAKRKHWVSGEWAPKTAPRKKPVTAPAPVLEEPKDTAGEEPVVTADAAAPESPAQVHAEQAPAQTQAQAENAADTATEPQAEAPEAKGDK
ncbi:hypothetical protein GCM10025876_13720 [Demequina litorisediminis]|uniref:Uncharacterized protein n=1 Tax=Demequina litorisediminis TaxID=1849022 RepID=A0ABQ6IBE2_9MICO|nr:hypothetical protein GCM10025876_13720 [Demequina litorisediminis]